MADIIQLRTDDGDGETIATTTAEVFIAYDVDKRYATGATRAAAVAALLDHHEDENVLGTEYRVVRAHVPVPAIEDETVAVLAET